MSGNKAVVDRLRKLAAREARLISKADSLLIQLAADLIEKQAEALSAASSDKDEAIRDACYSGALVSVARGQLAALIDLLERHA